MTVLIATSISKTNVEETNTDTITNQQHNIVEIEAFYASESEDSDVGEAAQ